MVIMAMMAGMMAGAEDAALPNPLVMQDGTAVTSANQWAQRRAELLELFRANVYGRNPVDRPANTNYNVTLTIDNELRIARERVTMNFTGPRGTISARLFIIRPLSDKPVPAFLLINHRDNDFDPTQKIDSGFWPAKQIAARGYATAILQAQDIDPDNFDGFKNGVHGIFQDPVERTGDAWGTIAAWAWGASRAMDYLEQSKYIDAKKVAVLGHSRGGKTALWCGAQDERFALVISNDSGCTGAALSRRPVGETVKDINDRFPHWFCENYRKYNANEAALPIDQHELLALVAPRLLYVASASLDTWADPEGEFLACVNAEPVWTLLGQPGLGATQFPAPDKPIHEGRIGYHLRTGKHELAEYDWNQYMDFADTFWR
jgi:hypothetical protein